MPWPLLVLACGPRAPEPTQLPPNALASLELRFPSVEEARAAQGIAERRSLGVGGLNSGDGAHGDRITLRLDRPGEARISPEELAQVRRQLEAPGVFTLHPPEGALALPARTPASDAPSGGPLPEPVRIDEHAPSRLLLAVERARGELGGWLSLGEQATGALALEGGLPSTGHAPSEALGTEELRFDAEAAAALGGVVGVVALDGLVVGWCPVLEEGRCPLLPFSTDELDAALARQAPPPPPWSAWRTARQVARGGPWPASGPALGDFEVALVGVDAP